MELQGETGGGNEEGWLKPERVEKNERRPQTRDMRYGHKEIWGGKSKTLKEWKAREQRAWDHIWNDSFPQSLDPKKPHGERAERRDERKGRGWRKFLFLLFMQTYMTKKVGTPWLLLNVVLTYMWSELYRVVHLIFHSYRKSCLENIIWKLYFTWAVGSMTSA